MKKTPHFKALINFKTSEDGGLVSPVSTGFRAALQFPFELKTYLGAHLMEEEDLIFPGDSVSVDIVLIDAEQFVSKLYKGMDFEISDSSGSLGSGVVTEIFSE